MEKLETLDLDKDSQEFQKFLDNKQYSEKGLYSYEHIFGTYYVSTGGEETTAKFCKTMNLKPGQKVLDVGCGSGGSAFYMARHYGVDVYGIDLSSNMIKVANDYRNGMEAGIRHRVQFHVSDATTMDYPEMYYDVIYSRDAILHIKDKLSLFKSFLRALKPGGKIFITDYCRGDKRGDEEYTKDFLDYVAQRGYHLLTVPEYGRVLVEAGFGDVNPIDNSEYFLEILKMELDRYIPKEAVIVHQFGEDEYKTIVKGWNDKIRRVTAGDQAWGLFMARRLFH